MQEVFGFSGKKMKWMCLCYLPRNRKFMPLCNYDSTWLIFIAYASPHIMERKILWSTLFEVAKLHNLPWLLLGDFN